jgi:hypothetical protein
MVQNLRYLLTPIVLVTLLWTSTFLHDFCEDALETVHETGHHLDMEFLYALIFKAEDFFTASSSACSALICFKYRLPLSETFRRYSASWLILPIAPREAILAALAFCLRSSGFNDIHTDGRVVISVGHINFLLSSLMKHV